MAGFSLSILYSLLLSMADAGSPTHLEGTAVGTAWFPFCFPAMSLRGRQAR
jgi:hypothetical protein